MGKVRGEWERAGKSGTEDGGEGQWREVRIQKYHVEDECKSNMTIEEETCDRSPHLGSCMRRVGRELRREGGRED